MTKIRKVQLLIFTAVLCCFSVLPQQSAASESASSRFYVGTETCRKCHDNHASGDQYAKWRLSAHAKGYAILSSKRSGLITKLSGLNTDPLKTPICLGCHTTASEAEEWQRDTNFDLSEGIQCEYCHGPGSDYANWKTMSNVALAKEKGLMFPDESFCNSCHKHKGSHEAFMRGQTVIFQHPEKGKTYFHYEEALAQIDHSGEARKASPATTARKNQSATDHYLGVKTCSSCHSEKDSGFCSLMWRLSKHADSYATLSTEKAQTIAIEKGLTQQPKNSPECLQCHTTWFHSTAQTDGSELVKIGDGVQCESCHGPGKHYTNIGDDNAHTNVPTVTEKTCLRCHNGYHGRSIDFPQGLAAIQHGPDKKTRSKTNEIIYKTPFNLALTKKGELLYVVCEASDSLIVIDTQAKTVTAEVDLMDLPHGITLSPDEKTIYVSNRGSDTVSVIDAESLQVIRTLDVGDEPHELVTNKSGDTLVVANTGSHDISVIDLKNGQEIKRLAGGRGTWGLAVSPDKNTILATNNLSHFVPFRTTSISELTLLDSSNMVVKNRVMVPDANLIQGVDYSPDGEFALVTLLRTKNLVPIVRVVQGWMITNGFGILWKDGTVDQLLIDGVDNHFADPTDVVITPDGKYAYITGGGVNEVAVLDIQRLKGYLKTLSDDERKNIIPNHLGVSGNYLAKRIPVGSGPRGLATDGKFVYVADALDDAISIIDIATQERIGTIDLGGPEIITQIRRGERIFHSAEVTYGKQYSCHSCHPDGGIDGLAYDISPDGLGVNPVDNRTLRGILDTAPFKWTGKNVSLSRQCGPRLAVFFTRSNPFTPEEARDLESYIVTIPRNPNRYLQKEGLTPTQERGKALFYRTHSNDGKEIPYAKRCNGCHSGSYFTNRQINNVGTSSQWDTHGKFDVPHLNNIYETAPYLHDGRANTLEEIWTLYNPDDEHGVTNDMTKDQLNDLIEYLKIL